MAKFSLLNRDLEADGFYKTGSDSSDSMIRWQLWWNVRKQLVAGQTPRRIAGLLERMVAACKEYRHAERRR